MEPAKEVRSYSKGQNNDFGDAETIVDAVQWLPRCALRVIDHSSLLKTLNVRHGHTVLPGRSCRASWEDYPTCCLTTHSGKVGVSHENYIFEESVEKYGS